MNALVLYDSVFGNTERLARMIAAVLGVSGSARAVSVAATSPDDLKGVDFLVVGSPTHGGMPMVGLKSFLTALPKEALRGVRVAAFDTGIAPAGRGVGMRLLLGILRYAAPRIGRLLSAKGGTLMSTKTFFVADREGPLVAGEEERAEAWARELVERVGFATPLRGYSA